MTGPLGRRSRLVVSRLSPVTRAGLPGGGMAGPGRHGVKNGAVERRVDDLVVGHVCPSLNPLNLSRAVSPGYVEKPEIVL